MYKFGDVLLLNYPFTSFAGTKKRPALFILDAHDGDMLVARITSKISHNFSDITITDFAEAGLLNDSCIRLSKLVALENRLAIRKLGELTSNDLSKVKATLQSMVDDL